MFRRRLLGILTAALLAPGALLLPVTAQAATPGPSAAAVEAEGIVTVARSEDGRATGVAVAGNEVTGTSGDGEGHLVSTKDAGLDQVEVTVAGTVVDGGSSSADTVRVAAGDDVHATALSSERDDDGASSTGLHVSAGGSDVRLLHSEADSSTGRTTVLEHDGTAYGVNEQEQDRLCTSELPAVIRAELFCAAGGEDGGAAAIVDNLTIEQVSAITGLDLTLLRANGAGSPSTVVPPESPDPSPRPPAPPAPSPAPPIVPASPSTPLPAPDPAPVGPLGDLPNTGAPALALVALGLAMVGTGTAMVQRDPA